MPRYTPVACSLCGARLLKTKAARAVGWVEYEKITEYYCASHGLKMGERTQSGMEINYTPLT